MDVASTLQSYFCCCLSVCLTDSFCLSLSVKCFGLMTSPTITEGDSTCKMPNPSVLIACLRSFFCLQNKWFEWSVICHLNVAVTVIFNTQTTGSLLLFSERMGYWDKEIPVSLTHFSNPLRYTKPCGLKNKYKINKQNQTTPNQRNKNKQTENGNKK